MGTVRKTEIPFFPYQIEVVNSSEYCYRIDYVFFFLNKIERVNFEFYNGVYQHAVSRMYSDMFFISTILSMFFMIKLFILKRWSSSAFLIH